MSESKDKIRLGVSQKNIARLLTSEAAPPRQWGTQGETEKIYERLCELGIAERVENPALTDRRRGPIYHLHLFKRGPQWAEIALRYGWITPAPVVKKKVK